MKRALVLLTSLALAVPAYAFDWGEMLKGVVNPSSSQTAPSATGIDALSSTDINAALKEALTRGADAAVAQLGVKDGFLANPQLKIPLPKNLQKAEKAMRMFGMGQQADDLVLAMNRAAEAAVPEAKTLLVESVKQMTLEDAKGILTGGQTSATDFFRKKTETQLTERFLPIVKVTTDKVGLAQQYNRYAGMAAQFNLVDKSQANVEQYVTQQSLDRLYTLIGEKEAAIRANPLQAGSDLLKKVFSTVTGK
ncbi:DUF4197 domain-containing protein [Acidovorax sp.]|uniref:DUF4197 domain-containing protein n=1 Tax=Acidovorax sp. TaxID=1872122 RepID=UPI000BC43517|nr:DUF4197 domain-containing protein [Acidovorax sp.]OYW62765.1 MAG: hypothetical protein B7Z32_14185 [Hydrogenophilales bacterium 12-64-13]OYZ06380.1 MAG: hypothetical protein B7Y26_05345 [Hydrogenophilales bacterium 16-64-46]OZA36594.1 MAG: hypothetical protein B7X87_13930 [Hydrogenophilales bacterium 17-64-34]HQT01379.1 DUF4197 domain-containing protein [Thiobacillus sp.]